ncbi:sodium transporter, partial [candidate division KSB1 bacterium]|nr:sodium transporter [candidate division KSB1 bacterium]
MIDTVVLIIYFSLIIGIGAYFSRGRKTSEDYFLAGKNMNWLVVSGSLLAVGISSEHLISLTASGASRGLAIAHFEWLAGLMVLILAWLFVPIYSRASVFTAPEFIEQRYNRSTRFIFSTFTILMYICTRMTVILFAGGWLLHQVLGWDIMTTTVVIVVLTGVYTIAGGLKAVMYTDVAGAIILVVGTIVLTFLGFTETGGFADLKSHLTPEFFSVLKPLTDADFPWLGVLLGAPIIGIWYWCTDQMVVQR